jgi:hypothetical protein
MPAQVAEKFATVATNHTVAFAALASGGIEAAAIRALAPIQRNVRADHQRLAPRQTDRRHDGKRAPLYRASASSLSEQRAMGERR